MVLQLVKRMTCVLRLDLVQKGQICYEIMCKARFSAALVLLNYVHVIQSQQCTTNRVVSNLRLLAQGLWLLKGYLNFLGDAHLL